MRRNYILCLFLVIGFQLANAQFSSINEGFETYTTNVFPNQNWVMVYNGTGNSNQKVVDSPVFGGNKSLQLEGSSNNSSECYIVINNIPDKVIVEAQIMLERDILNGMAGSIGLGDFTKYPEYRTSRLMFIYGKFYASYTDGPQVELCQLVSKKWNNVRLEHDLTAKKYRVFINDTLRTATIGGNTVSEFPMHQTAISKHLILCSGNDANIKVFFDDIKVYASSSNQLNNARNTFQYYCQDKNLYLENLPIPTEFKLIGLDGRCLISKKLNSKTEIIQMQSLSDGIYLVQLNNSVIKIINQSH